VIALLMEGSGSTDWLGATAMLLSGLVIGIMFIYSATRKKESGAIAADDALELRDLEEQRDALIRQLRELDDAPGKQNQEQSNAERDRLERAAAMVLRAIDVRSGAAVIVPAAKRAAATVAVSAAPAPAAGFFAERPALRGFLWGVLSVGAIAGLAFYVTNSAKQRGESDGLTGGGPAQMEGASATAQPQAQSRAMENDPAVRQLEAAIKARPDDLESRVGLAKAYLEHENMMGVFEQTQYVLQRTPNDARALTYQALVQLAMGRNTEALEMLKHATVADPSLLDAWVSLAWAYTETGKPSDAAATMKEAIRRHPEEEARLTDILAQMRVQGAQHAGNAADAAPSDSVIAPMTGTPTGPAVNVTIALDASVKGRAPKSGFLFIYARAAGVTAGPPAAAKRLPMGTFPLSVTLSQADSMMGAPLPATLRIEARTDSDGNPMTHDADGLSAAVDGVAAGANVTLQLH
jgi:tetratricopeptide (TPR) repeat protein